MKVSFSTLGCPKMTFRDVFATAKDLGYDGVEVRGIAHIMDAPNIREFAPEKVQETKTWLESLGISIPILTSACYMHRQEEWEETAALAKGYIATASRLGTPYVRVLLDAGPAPAATIDDGLVQTHLEEIASYAKGQGVEILVETNGAYADSKRLRALLERVDIPVGVIWDMNHPFSFFNEQPETTLENLAGYIRHTHVKDSILQDGKLCYQMVGHGNVPVKKATKLLLDAGYDGYFSLEWVKRWDMTLEEPGIAFANYIAYMRSL